MTNTAPRRSWFGYDVFVSYAHGDGRSSAEELARELEQRGLRTFLDSGHLDLGDSLAKEIPRQLRRSSLHVVLLTPLALGSQWVAREVEAFHRLRPKRPQVPVFFGQKRAAPSPGESLGLPWKSAGELAAKLQSLRGRLTRRRIAVLAVALTALVIACVLALLAANARKQERRRVIAHWQNLARQATESGRHAPAAFAWAAASTAGDETAEGRFLEADARRWLDPGGVATLPEDRWTCAVRRVHERVVTLRSDSDGHLSIGTDDAERGIGTAAGCPSALALGDGFAFVSDRALWVVDLTEVQEIPNAGTAAARVGAELLVLDETEPALVLKRWDAAARALVEAQRMPALPNARCTLDASGTVHCVQKLGGQAPYGAAILRWEQGAWRELWAGALQKLPFGWLDLGRPMVSRQGVSTAFEVGDTQISGDTVLSLRFVLADEGKVPYVASLPIGAGQVLFDNLDLWAVLRGHNGEITELLPTDAVVLEPRMRSMTRGTDLEGWAPPGSNGKAMYLVASPQGRLEVRGAAGVLERLDFPSQENDEVAQLHVAEEDGLVAVSARRQLWWWRQHEPGASHILTPEEFTLQSRVRVFENGSVEIIPFRSSISLGEAAAGKSARGER
jgi:hypothetical protein